MFRLTIWRLQVDLLTLIGIRSCGNQRWADTIHKHILAVEVYFERFSLLNDFVNSLAQIFGFEVCSSLRTLVLLPCIVFSVDSFIIVKVNVICILVGRYLWLTRIFISFLLVLIQVFINIGQLVYIIIFFLYILVILAIKSGCLLSMNSPLLIHFSYL